MDETTNPAYFACTRLAREVFGGIWPHDDTLPKARVPRRDLPQDLMIPEVTADTKINKGDVLVAREYDRVGGYSSRTMLDRFTAREFILRDGVRFWLVESATAKTITYRLLAASPTGGYTDLSNWAATAIEHTDRSHRISRLREIGYLGPIQDIAARIAAHPAFADWREAHAAALAEREQQMEERRQEQETAKPVQEAADLLNKILGDQAISIWTHPSPHVYAREVWKWLLRDGHGEVYIHGLNRLGRIDGPVMHDALNALETLLRYGKQDG